MTMTAQRCEQHPKVPDPLTCKRCRALAIVGVARSAAMVPEQPVVRRDFRPLEQCPLLGERLPGPCGATWNRCGYDGLTVVSAGQCSEQTRNCNTCTVRPAGARPKGWQTRPEVKAAHQRAAREFKDSIGEPPNGFAGRGIVIAGGGAYWPSVYVTVRMIRHLGCDLPIQVWYLGSKGEHDDRYVSILDQLGAECIDADAHPARASRRIVNGFEVKLFAVLNSPFREVLYLDADCYPCVDPSPLFDEPGFRSTGAVYWPDMPKTNGWTHWDFWGVEPFGQECGWEVGQYLVDKVSGWKPLKLAEWYDDHSDWCYGAGIWSDHGDKGPHRVAWAAHRMPVTFYNTRAVWSGIAFLQPGPDGKSPAFVHRCRSKFTVAGHAFSTTPQNGTNLLAGFPMENEAFRFLDDLRGMLK